MATFTGRLTILSVSLLTTAFTIAAPEPAFARLDFCNRTSGGSPLTLALAHYNFGRKHVRRRRDGSPGLTIVLNPRWTIRGVWEIPHNECITAIDRDLNLRYYYYYAQSQDDSYDDSGSYPICARRHGRFHLEYQMKDNELVQILALTPSGIDSASASSATNLEEACADLGYELLPFNQLYVGDAENYTLNFAD